MDFVGGSPSEAAGALAGGEELDCIIRGDGAFGDVRSDFAAGFFAMTADHN